MVRSELVQLMAKDFAHLSRTEIDAGVVAITSAMTKALVEGRRIELRGFGAFSPGVRPSYAGRNPATGEAVTVPARPTIAFKVGAPLLARLNPHL